jgi:DNA-binding LytR/AlgR family response regulator
MTMKAIEAKLPAGFFVRTHKSFLVPVSKITTVKRDLVCIGKMEIPLSEIYREKVSQVIKSL